MKNSKVVYLCVRECETYGGLSIDELASHKRGITYIIPVDAVMCGIKSHSTYCVIGE